MDGPTFVRSDVRCLSGYVPGEQPRDRTYVKLNTNESPYPPSPGVLEALRTAATSALRLYPDPLSTALRERAAAVYGVLPDQVLVGNGSDELLGIVIRACIGPNDRVAYPVPTYSLYPVLVALQAGSAIEVAFPEDFALPTSALVAAGGRITLVCNPNAPSGTLAPLGPIAELARGSRGLVVVDEAYVDYASEGASALPLLREHSNIVVLRTFSKSFSLCGMRVGLAFGAPEVIRELEKVKDSYNVGQLGQVAAVAALEDLAWMRANAKLVCATRDRLAGALRTRGFIVLPSETNFLLARLPDRDDRVRRLCRGLRDRGVLVRYFDLPTLRDAIRITVGTPDEVGAFLRAMDEVLAI